MPVFPRTYTPNLDQLAERLLDRDLHRAFAQMQRNGYTIEFDAELGGRHAAFDSLERIVSAGGLATVIRTNDHDPDSWTLTVERWGS
jgi:hypothetical protein